MREEQRSLHDMDVTFTNVLEGARQYFAGLPAASDTGAGVPAPVPAPVTSQPQHPPRANYVPAPQQPADLPYHQQPVYHQWPQHSLVAQEDNEKQERLQHSVDMRHHNLQNHQERIPNTHNLQNHQERIPNTHNLQNHQERIPNTHNLQNHQERIQNTHNLQNHQERVSNTHNLQNHQERVSNTHNLQNHQERIQNTHNLHNLQNHQERVPSTHNLQNHQERILVNHNNLQNLQNHHDRTLASINHNERALMSHERASTSHLSERTPHSSVPHNSLQNHQERPTAYHQERPPQHHPETNKLHTIQNQQESKIIQNYYQPQQYQYSRIVENNQYYPQNNQNVNQVNQSVTMPRGRVEQKNTFQQPKDMYNGYQSYYPPHTKSQSPAAPPNSSYQRSSHSTSSYTTQSYSVHSQSPVQTQTQYLSTKESYSENYRNHRTHNLPPIAALSSVNYSKTSRELPRIQPVQRSRTQSYVVTTAVPVPSTQPRAVYTQTIQRSNSFTSSGYQERFYPTTPAYTTASTSTSKFQSSYQYLPKDLPQRTEMSTIIAETTNPKQKKESPLDLSVKTVRTTADSTLDDLEADRYKAFKNKMYSQQQQMQQHQLQQSQMHQQQQHPHQPNGVPYAVKEPVQRPRSFSIASTGAPKVDFLPNFSSPSLHAQTNNETYYKNEVPYQNYQNNQNVRHTYHVQNDKELPRYDYTKTAPNVAQNVQQNVQQSMQQNMQQNVHQNMQQNMQQNVRKRSTDSPNTVPNKVPKVDSWRATIDQQIEQRLSSYANTRLQQEQQYKQLPNVQFAKPSNQPKPYVNQYYSQQNQQFRNEQYVDVNQQQYYSNSQNQYEMYNLQRSSSTPKLNQKTGAADKRILSILRNSLEIKGAKEAQKKLDQTKVQNIQTGVQHPSTDVTAPLQPKPGIHSRHNISPFTASNILERNSNTPPSYKFHFPRAVDSVKFESDTLIKEESYPEDKMTASGNSNTPPMGANTGDLDGLAAFLAQRIRTKAELKQVSSQQNKEEIKEIKVEEKEIIAPKLNRETQPSRRKLFSKSEDDVNGIVPRNTALRSSSETSVFDFRDSDSEGEMPVLERQSLEDMRRDRRSSKPQPVVENLDPEIVIEDDFWANCCEKFVEQLQNNSGKKRGRRKKVIEAEMVVKLEETVEVKESEVVIKQEIIEDCTEKTEENVEPIEQCITPAIKQEVIEEPEKLAENDSDSDVPLNQIRKPVIKKENDFSDDEEVMILCKKGEKIGAKTKLEYSSDSDSDNTEKIESVSRKLFTKKSKKQETQKMVLRSADSSPVKKTDVKTFLKKKTIYGDGSDFHPGWEEAVFKYKKSVRMPASLINVTRPHWHRMSTSLPDLDACSPAPSSITDEEFMIKPKLSMVERLKKEILDSDSNSNTPKEENKIKNKKESILDVLVERYSKFRKRRKLKEKKNGPKIIPKSSNLLLPTPSLGIGNGESKEKPKKGKIKKQEEVDTNNSVYLGFFRKETVNNFRDTFKKSPGFMGMGEPFSPIVLKSRTRTETRVMKQRATIREVFGEDRPASAPPMTCHDDDSQNSRDDSRNSREDSIKSRDDNKNTRVSNQISLNEKEKKEKSPTKNKENKESIKSSLRSANSPKKSYLVKKKNNLLKNVNTEIKEEKQLKCETPSIESKTPSVISEAPSVKSETPSIKSETQSLKSETTSVCDENSDVSTVPAKKRIKLTKMRRKFSSGFDYIRKKKKIIKKEDVEASLKPKRRNLIPKQNPESVEDIQKEIKTWVMNKGVGETHLHRAARLGYTDVTAYCLEKMDCPPSPKDNAGYTPLHEACSRGHLEIARLLLQYGANVSDSAQGGIRPLHEAAENGYVEIIRLLLSYGADPNLATYSGLAPLALATDERTKYILKNYVADMEGKPAPPWNFTGPASFFDNANSGYNPLEEAPSPEPESEDSDMELEISEAPLPNLYSLRDEPISDRWILLQDLSAILKIKSRDTLLRQISSASTSSAVNKSLIREMKFSEFMEKARCCTLLCGNEKLSVRSSKVALVKYTDKVKKLLGVEKFIVPTDER